ncbi:hypothetical protein H5410_046003 [Solanum commersonii]|uniref:Uncharacterized protein n=1 Tax=Solanum commersonii TaxID=4109 RepID=A0A9J5XB36_SOLCO|nr:hypothetical protein H5410_046003 [Solanum commersonii]
MPNNAITLKFGYQVAFQTGPLSFSNCLFLLLERSRQETHAIGVGGNSSSHQSQSGDLLEKDTSFCAPLNVATRVFVHYFPVLKSSELRSCWQELSRGFCNPLNILRRLLGCT